MPRRRFGIWAASLGAICVSASTVPIHELFARQSSCAPNYKQCKDGGFPDNFCCPPGQNCVALAGNTTVLCCPDGKDCRRIVPLSCDISLQDAETNPDAVVKTTALGGTLGKCGDACCPFGYSCTEQKDCMRDQNQNAVPIQTGKPEPTKTGSPTKPTTSASTGTKTSTTPDANSAAESPSTTNDSPEASNAAGGPPVAAIAGGVTAGAVVLIGAAVLAFIFLRKKKAASEVGSPPKLSRSTSSFGNLISNPILGPNTAVRTDFARVAGPRDSTPPEDPDSVTGAVIADSLTSPSAKETLTVPAATATTNTQRQSASNVAYGYGGPELEAAYVDMPYVDYDHDGGGLMPETPRQHREPSSVSINIFADPNITPDRTPESNQDRRYTNMTTFTQMLDSAGMGGMAKGESYVPYGGHDPMPGGQGQK